MVQNRILVPGKPLSFSQFFELPFTLGDVLAEFDVELERAPLSLLALEADDE